MLCLIGCVSRKPGDGLSLQQAIDGLVVEDGQGGSRYQEASARVNRAETPSELRLLLAHLDDPRPSPMLEALATVDGSPVVYTVGDCIRRILVGKFVDLSLPRSKQADPIFRSMDNAAMRKWFAEHDYDLRRLRADHARRIQDVGGRDGRGQ